MHGFSRVKIENTHKIVGICNKKTNFTRENMQLVELISVTREYAVERISGSQKFVSHCHCARTASDDPSTDAMFDGHVTTWETSS